MKKTILLIVACMFIFNNSYSQVKVNIQLTNRHVDANGLFCFDVVAVIPSGQTWRVGSSNIRIDFYTVPTGKLTVHPDSLQAINPLACLNSGNYSPMTTTAINNRTALSLNITRTGPCCYLTNAGSPYRLATLRWNRVDTTGCTHDTIRYTSVVQDSTTPLVHGTGWGSINPTGQDTCALLTPVGPMGNELPSVYKLYDNYPNPFNPSTTIKYDIPQNSFVKLVIYDILGKDVVILVNEKKTAGRYSVVWNASSYASGTYFYKLETDSYTDVKKMVLVK